MTKTEMKQIISDSINPPQICRVYFNYDQNYFYFFPLKCADKLFLGTEEHDFLLDGYSIRRFRDMKKVEVKNDKCLEINRLEGNIDKIKMPEVDITSWETVFNSLKQLGKNIIIQKESINLEESQFFIGKIEDVHSKFLTCRNFDADGVWDDELSKIPYTSITSVTFGSIYVDIFSKYLPKI
jgi:hypothetical protein